LIADYKGFLLMILPPGGVSCAGFLLAVKRIIDQRMQQSKVVKADDAELKWATKAYRPSGQII